MIFELVAAFRHRSIIHTWARPDFGNMSENVFLKKTRIHIIFTPSMKFFGFNIIWEFRLSANTVLKDKYTQKNEQSLTICSPLMLKESQERLTIRMSIPRWLLNFHFWVNLSFKTRHAVTGHVFKRQTNEDLLLFFFLKKVASLWCLLADPAEGSLRCDPDISHFIPSWAETSQIFTRARPLRRNVSRLNPQTDFLPTGAVPVWTFHSVKILV